MTLAPPMEDDKLSYDPAEDSFVTVVSELAARTGQSKAEVLASALNLYYDFVAEQQSTGQEKIEIFARYYSTSSTERFTVGWVG